jgi:large subunit ribosomal protein L10
MAKTRQQKEEIVARVSEKFKKSKAAAFSSISGFNMNQANELREKAAEKDVDVFVTKKSLLAIAAKEAGFEGDDISSLNGSILTAIGYSDEVSAAKILRDLTKANENVSIVAGILEGSFISSEETIKLAALPSKEELLSKLVGSLNAPVSGFVNTLAANLRGFVTVLDAIKEKKA